MSQRLLDVLGCGVRVQHVNGPVHAPRAYAGAAALQIIPHRVVGTAGAHSAVHAALRRACGGFFRTEQIIVAVRAYIARPLARKPDENVHIVAALCQDHRAGFVRSAPVAAHIAVRLMPVAHLFHGLDGYHLADAAVLDDPLDGIVKRRIAQHMAHHHMALIPPRQTQYLQAALNVHRHRFFQQ